MSFDNIRRQREIAAADEAAIASESQSVFIAGPYIDIEEAAEHEENAATAGKRLRYALCQHFNGLGADVYMGEDDFLRKNGEKNFGQYNNAATYERHHLKKHTDAVIVLPCSPGSFCEIGDWATTDSISKKSLVIIDSEHHGQNNYINDGVAKLAQLQGAVVKYLPYDDLENIKNICVEFVDAVKSKQRLDKLYAN